MRDYIIFAGSAGSAMACLIAQNLGIGLGKMRLFRFSDGELGVEVDEDVYGCVVTVVQTASYPVNDRVLETCFIVDALKRAGARQIILVMPYFAYARQDLLAGRKTSLSSQVIANILQHTGVEGIIAIDVHSAQLESFFTASKLQNLATTDLFAADWVRYAKRECMVVAPDMGSVARAENFARQIGMQRLVVIEKRRFSKVTKVVNVSGDVVGQDCVIVDDIVDTGGTICNATEELLARGASKVTAYCTHGIFSADALWRIAQSGLAELVVTDTISLRMELPAVQKIRLLSVAPLISAALDVW